MLFTSNALTVDLKFQVSSSHERRLLDADCAVDIMALLFLFQPDSLVDAVRPKQTQCWHDGLAAICAAKEPVFVLHHVSNHIVQNNHH